MHYHDGFPFVEENSRKEPEEEPEKTETKPTLLTRIYNYFSHPREEVLGSALEQSLLPYEPPIPFPEHFHFTEPAEINGRLFYSFQVSTIEAMQELSLEQFRYIGALQLDFSREDLNERFQGKIDGALTYHRDYPTSVNAGLILSGSLLMTLLHPEVLAVAIPTAIAKAFLDSSQSFRLASRNAFQNYQDICLQIERRYFTPLETNEPYR